MQVFTHITGIAAALPPVNIDTDKIIPAKFLKTVSRKGLGAGLFYAMRFDANGNEHADFVLNRWPWRQAEILIAGDNFGCGSSREHAPWALLDFGFRCIVAPSFADIFYNNCFKNGILPIVLDEAICAQLQEDALQSEMASMTVDLTAQTIKRHSGKIHRFEIDQERKNSLLQGIDEIGLSLTYFADIEAFEKQQRAAWPWLTPVPLPASKFFNDLES